MSHAQSGDRSPTKIRLLPFHLSGGELSCEQRLSYLSAVNVIADDNRSAGAIR
jgi:hypothetical protein